MDEQAQMQAIVDKLTGVPPGTLPLPAALDEPWRSIYLRVQPTALSVATSAVKRA